MSSVRQIDSLILTERSSAWQKSKKSLDAHDYTIGMYFSARLIDIISEYCVKTDRNVYNTRCNEWSPDDSSKGDGSTG